MSELEWMEIFGDNLRSLLEEKGYSQRDLANAIGVSESTVSSYINKQKIPGVKALINIAYEFDLTMNELMDFGDRIR